MKMHLVEQPGLRSFGYVSAALYLCVCALAPLGFQGQAVAGELRLENKAIAWRGEFARGTLRPVQVDDRLNAAKLALSGECFIVALGDGTVLKASDFALSGEPAIEPLRRDADSPTRAKRLAGRQLVAKFSAPEKNLSAEWRVSLRDGSTYVRQELALRAVGRDVLVKEITLFEQAVPGAKVMGTVDGSPVVAGDFFLGYEHPMSSNAVAGGIVRCSFLRNAVLKDGEVLAQSFVIGAVPHGQLRRGFLAYVERERTHPYRPFLHYNSWYDIAWNTRKFTEAESIDAIEHFGRELVKKRGVKMDSFLFDDGWDDNQSLWQFHSGFPNGFTPVGKAAAKLPAGIGVWLSPFGGYQEPKRQRLEYGSKFGFETNASGFSLAGPKYYQRFRDICLEMIQKYNVNQFKFDGLAAGAKASADGLTRDGDAMLRLVSDFRAAKPDIYINQTTGTWPSPFWLLHVDSTWRGGWDHSHLGKGSDRQQWITYRDSETFNNVVRQGPLYPLNALMLHGIVYATNATKLSHANDKDFQDEVRSFFGTGTQLQELYITPALLNERNWDDLAAAANWARANADVLVDTHWIGGDPGKGEVYGWAAWSPRKAILVLRNPDDKAATLTADVRDLFELPAGARTSYELRRPWKEHREFAPLKLQAGKPHTFNLQPFEVLVLEAK